MVLVTGANGFIGKFLCTALLRQGFRVRAAVRSPIQIQNNAEIVTIDTIDGNTDWTNALHGVDVVIHLAARVHIMKDTASNPLAEFLKVNRDGTGNLARQTARSGCKRFVYVSSIKVNGEETHGQQCYTEQDIPLPQDPYGISKWQAEQILQQIAKETGLETIIIRPPLVYGPGVKGNFYSLMKIINKEVPMPLSGARGIRNMVYVGNLVSALIVCATHPAATGQTYFVRDKADISTVLLIEKIAAALGRRNRTFYVPPILLRTAAAMLGRSQQINRLFGSLRLSDTKIHQQLGWVPPYSLEQGLHATASWYQRGPAAPSESQQAPH